MHRTHFDYTGLTDRYVGHPAQELLRYAQCLYLGAKGMRIRYSIATLVMARLLFCGIAIAQTDELTVKLDNLTSMKERDAKRAEMRGFLWKHWNEKRPATLFLTAVSKEGKITHSQYHIAILPGALLLKVTFIRDRTGHQGQVIPKPDGAYEACTIERVQSENPFGVGAKAKITVLPWDAAVPPEKYWLRFKGWNDTLITYF
jgi:hypothetical protein